MADDGRPTRYFALYFRIFRFLGIGWWHHPDENNRNNFSKRWYICYSIFTITGIVIVFVVLEAIDPFIGEKDMERFMFSLSLVVTHVLTLSKLYIFIKKSAHIQDITWTLEIGMYDYFQNNKKNKATIRLSKIITGFYIFFGWMTVFGGDAYGAMEDRQWKKFVATLNDTSVLPERSLPQPIYVPWDYHTDLAYTLTITMQTTGIMWTGHILILIDMFVASIILHISTQFETLNEAIRTAYDRTMLTLREDIHPDANNIQEEDLLLSTEELNERIVESFLSKEEIDAALLATFRKCFQQHQAIINCTQNFQIHYSFGFMTQLVSSMSGICVVMVQVSQDVSSLDAVNLLTSLAFFIFMTLQLFIQCFTGNELTLQAESISDAVMDSKWEFCPPEHRRLLLIMMMRAQKPLRLDAAGFAYMNNACFLSIMKGAYSYYAVLSQKQGE